MYYVKAKDTEGNWIDVEVSAEVYALFLEDAKLKKKLQQADHRHLSFLSVEDEATYLKSFKHQQTPDEETILRDELNQAQEVISSCTEIQQKRFYLHNVLGLNYEEIAQKQGTCISVVYKSVQAVEKKLEELKKSF